MAEENENKKEEVTPSWAQTLTEAVNRLSLQLTKSEEQPTDEVVEVPLPPTPKPTEAETETEETEQETETPKPSRLKKLMDYLF